MPDSSGLGSFWLPSLFNINWFQHLPSVPARWTSECCWDTVQPFPTPGSLLLHRDWYFLDTSASPSPWCTLGVCLLFLLPFWPDAKNTIACPGHRRRRGLCRAPGLQGRLELVGVHSADPAGLQQVRKTVHGWSPWPQGRPGGGGCRGSALPGGRCRHAWVLVPAPWGFLSCTSCSRLLSSFFLAERKNLWLICE